MLPRPLSLDVDAERTVGTPPEITTVTESRKRARVQSETEERFEAEAAYERSVWPAAVDGTAASAAVDVEIRLSMAEMTASLAERLPARGRPVDRNSIAVLYGDRAPEAAALARAPRHLLDVAGLLFPVHETAGGEVRLRSDVARLRVDARIVCAATLAGEQREGRAGAASLVPAFVQARMRSARPEANATAKLSEGVHVPPRAHRLGPSRLRTLAGILDALETEGSAASMPMPPRGLRNGLCLSEYQSESLGWMLARETSHLALEDLLEITLVDGLVATSLPGGGVTLADRPRPRHRGGILAEEMVSPVSLGRRSSREASPPRGTLAASLRPPLLWGCSCSICPGGALQHAPALPHRSFAAS